MFRMTLKNFKALNLEIHSTEGNKRWFSSATFHVNIFRVHYLCMYLISTYYSNFYHFFPQNNYFSVKKVTWHVLTHSVLLSKLEITRNTFSHTGTTISKRKMGKFLISFAVILFYIYKFNFTGFQRQCFGQRKGFRNTFCLYWHGLEIHGFQSHSPFLSKIWSWTPFVQHL